MSNRKKKYRDTKNYPEQHRNFHTKKYPELHRNYHTNNEVEFLNKSQETRRKWRNPVFLKIESNGMRLIVLYAHKKLVTKEFHILNNIHITLANRLLENKSKEFKASRGPEFYSYLELKRNWICSGIYQNYWKSETKIQFRYISTVLGSR